MSARDKSEGGSRVGATSVSMEVTGAEALSATSCPRNDDEGPVTAGGWTKAAHRTRAVILGEVDGGAFGGMLVAAVLSGSEERASKEQATPLGDYVKGRRTTTSSGVRPSLDAGVGGMSDAAVTGVDDDMGAGLN